MIYVRKMDTKIWWKWDSIYIIYYIMYFKFYTWYNTVKANTIKIDYIKQFIDGNGYLLVYIGTTDYKTLDFGQI